VLSRYRSAAAWTLAAFALAVVDSAAAFAWMLRDGGNALYALVDVLFAALLVVVLGVAVGVTRMLVWR
jgi:hypothetical protein